MPLAIVPTGIKIGVQFEMMQITVKSYEAALNGGTTTTVSGTGATTLTKYEPPTLSGIVRRMIGWESEDCTERAVWYQCLQSGTVQVAREKGANNATIPANYAVEQPATGAPFTLWTAGTKRVGS